MPAYKNIALAGAGNLGRCIISAFANKDVSLRVLSRKDSQDALEGVEIVISTLGSFCLDQEESLARAAKAAGVHLFIPSEFGNPTLGVKKGLLSSKAKMHDILDEIGLPYTLIFTGPWPEFVISPMFGFNFPTKVTVPGDGRQPVVWTTRASIASFLAGVLTSSSLPALPPVIRLEGNRASFRDIATLYETVKGIKLKIEETPISELAARVTHNPQDGPTFVLKEYAEGRGGVGEPNGQKLFPDWQPEKLVNILSTM